MRGKKSKKSVTAKKKKDRAKHRCTPALASLIGFVNMIDAIPPGSRPPEVEADYNDFSKTIHDLARTATMPTGGMKATFKLVIGADGRIEYDKERYELVQVLIGVKADRLRECVICQRIFWARQDNMVACGSRCGNANRQRRLRERQGEYERAREKKRRKTQTGTRRK